MVNGTYVQEKIYFGYGKAATRIGQLYTIYRSIDGNDPLNPGNVVQDIYVSPTVAWSYMVPKKYGDNTWILVVDGRVLQVGDYLVGPKKIFFIAAMDHLLPIVGVLCDRFIEIRRPKTAAGIGDVGYSGYINNDPSTYDVLHYNVPAGFLKSSRGEKNIVDLPTSAKMPWYAVFMPLWDSAFIRNGDIIVDDRQQDYLVCDNEHTELGWHLNVHGLEA